MPIMHSRGLIPARRKFYQSLVRSVRVAEGADFAAAYGHLMKISTLKPLVMNTLPW